MEIVFEKSVIENTNEQNCPILFGLFREDEEPRFLIAIMMMIMIILEIN